MRYTEARLAPIAEEVLRDIEKETVKFVPNFDESLREPAVLPSLLPTLLVNGAAGIAVGMATNIPPHNLGEVVDALVALIARPTMKPESLRKYLQGPDFPTGAMIIGDEGIKQYFKTGRGKLTVHAKAHIEEMRGGRERIVVTEIPFQVNKAGLQEKVADLVRDRKIEGISEVRDESDREGMRIVFELRKEVSAEKVLKDLYKHTHMSTTFGVIMLALVGGQPKVLSIRDVLSEFLNFRHNVVLRRTKFELDKAEKRAHILEGYIIALDNIDEVIAVIKKSRTVDTARANLRKKFKLSEIQAQAILDMRLQRLTGLERKKIEQEYRDLLKLIERLKAILGSKALRMQVVKDELLGIKEKYGDARRTQIIGKKAKATNLKELMREEKSIVTMTHKNLIKRTSLSEYETDKKAIKPSTSRDFVQFSALTSNSHFLLFFTNTGMCYTLRTSFVPAAGGDSDGAALNRLIKLKKNEQIVNMVAVVKFDQDQFVMLGSRDGQVKRILLSALSKKKEDGLEVMSLKSDDQVVSAFLTDGNRQVIIGTAHGMAIRFSEQDVRDMGLSAGGVRGIALADKDRVISIVPLEKKKSKIFTITSKGFGKCSALSQYSTIKRGGKGIFTFKLSDRVGDLVGLLEVEDKDQILFLTQKGKAKRVRAKSVKVMGRATQGAPLVALAQNDALVSAQLKPQESFKN